MRKVIAFRPDQRLVNAAMMLPVQLTRKFMKAAVAWYDEDDQYYQLIVDVEERLHAFHGRSSGVFERSNYRIVRLMRQYTEFSDSREDLIIMREVERIREYFEDTASEVVSFIAHKGDNDVKNS